MIKKKVWIILLALGIIPFAIPIISGLYNSINGFSGLCILDCDYYYGFNALMDSVILYSFIFWPTYIVGAILIVLSIMKLKKKKKIN